MGTDVREFLLDGGDANGSNKIIGVDLQQGFIDLGQDLYKGPTPGIEFRAANLLDSSDNTLDDIKGKVTILYTGAVFHLFKEDDQRIFAKKINTLVAKEAEVAIFGMHRGQKVAGLRISRSGKNPYGHDPQSWKKLWTEVLGEDVKNWSIKAELKASWTPAEYVNEDYPVLQWSLWRNKL